MRSFIFFSWTVASALGAVQAVCVLSARPGLPLLEAASVFFYSWIGYGLLSAAIAFCRQRFGRESDSLDQALGVAVGTVTSIYAVWMLAQEHRPLYWLVPGCVVYGVFVGWLASRISERLGWLRAPVFWNALSGICLLIGTGIVVLPGMNSKSALPRAAESRPNIVLVSVDTLRRDRLGCYGYKKAITPNIDHLAQESVVFEQALSEMALTGPSHTSMLTGMYARNHGAISNGIPLRQSVSTVPETLSAAGYDTAAFVSGWTLKHSATGLAARFDLYDDNFSRWRLLPDAVLNVPLIRLIVIPLMLSGYKVDQLERTAEMTTGRALQWIAGKHEKPFFLFVHYFDPHSPHFPPPPYDKLHDPNYQGDTTLFHFFQPLEVRRRIVSEPRTLEHIQSNYDGEISYIDSQIARLLPALWKVSENTVVIFTADHGESLTEHNFYFDHGEYLYDTCLRVPLLIRMPHGFHAGLRRSPQVRLIDLAPTVLQLASVKSSASMDGQSLIPVIEGSEQADRPGFGSILFGQLEGRRSRYSLRYGGYKLIWNFDRREDLSRKPAYEEFYDLSHDPGETKNLSTEMPPMQHMRELLQGWIPGFMTSIPQRTEEEKERLRALGYI